MNKHIPFKKAYYLIILLGFFLSFLSVFKANATHIRAGEIIVLPDSSKTGDQRFRCVVVKLITYTDFSQTNADNPDATFFFGDGSSQKVDRWRRTVARAEDTYRSVYYSYHCYPAGGTYTITYAESNRAIGVANIANSESQTFLLRTTITLDPFIGINNSPRLLPTPLDYAACGQVFVHNPGAVDRDGDSLVFRLQTPQRNTSGDNNNLRAGDVLGYRPLNDPSLADPGNNCPPPKLSMDRLTGQLVWESPCLAGDYNVAFVVEEYRNGRKIGEVLRDMQIRVRCVNNKRPVLKIPRDTCVVAGTTVIGRVSATDPENLPVFLEAFSGIIPPATFTQSGNNGTFRWNTTCTDVREQPYQVIFKVTDTPPAGTVPLTDIQPWNIKVIGPAPENFKVRQEGSSFVLDWDNYVCPNATRILIFRHEGISNFSPDYCETGIPASAGFVQVGDVGINQTTFTDNGGPDGLKKGVDYCYSIYAVFPGPNGSRVVAGIATKPVCAIIESNIPILTNVSVERTDEANGEILVRWVKPTASLQDLAQPLQYRLFRAPGETPANFTEIFRTNNLDETSFLDRNISTTANNIDVKWIYKIELYQGPGTGTLVDNATPGTSVQLKGTSDGTNITLNWTYNVPWNNTKYKHYIYRQINNVFTLIDSVAAGATSGQYVDRGTFQNLGLQQNVTYCYYILTRGGYDNPKLPRLLLNKSQVACIAHKDITAPCPPELSIDQLDCENFIKNPTMPPYQNVLTWVPGQGPGCDQDIQLYTIYFRPGDEGDFTKLATVNGDITTYTHGNLQSFAGCYVVTATDFSGNESVHSNTVCKDNCFFFQLPNIITPNGDGRNDVFTPDRRSTFVKSVKFTVYSRWGDKVYDGNGDPAINWRGVNNAGKQVSDGTYYYVAEVEFITLSPKNSKQTFKGWVEIAK
ncbi:gliding motility-associated C-terminal domain-containing protein [Adhaeribacter aquaticus]|uniref:T9SS type B sorting domain-containing protein n=1 Tax=Adhaeribacter aquaticus TaxID=299567 RepID=UPI0004117D2A|nr:gliding motility-associated C-terminal domain-containing protein [Adhaeribacter aquaticus]